MSSHTKRILGDQPQYCKSLKQIICCLLIAALLLPVSARAQNTQVQSLALPQIPPGTLVEGTDNSRWNTVVLLARPTLASGDRDMIPESISKLVPTFVLTILATVESYAPPASAERKFRLKEVGVGFSTEVDGQLKVVTPDSASKLGANLGFVQKRMLSTNQAQLETTKVIARTSTLLIFDAPSLMYRGGKHRDYVTRHFIWIDSKKGSNAALVWLLEKDKAGKLSVAKEPMRFVPRGTRENRKTHVDRNEFMLGGIPTERSFALEDLPPGKPVAWTPQTESLAALSQYSESQLRQLTVSLSQALQTMGR